MIRFCLHVKMDVRGIFMACKYFDFCFFFSKAENVISIIINIGDIN